MSNQPQSEANSVDQPRPDLEVVRRNYQVASEGVITYHPHLGGVVPIPVASVRVTRTEGELLNSMTARRGIDGLMDFKHIHDSAFEESAKRYPDTDVPDHVGAGRGREWQGNDGHRDAFRHAYWNALMAKEFGQDWARAFGTAHEGLPDNPANREAMDLFNNEVGREIAAEHPNASANELARLVDAAVSQGRMVVVDKHGDLAWSDQVTVGQHGLSPTESMEPNLKTPESISPDPRTSSEVGSMGQVPLEGNQRYSELYASISCRVDALDQQLGRQSDQKSECMKASLTTLAASKGFEQVDHVVLSSRGGETQAGQNVFIVQGDPANPSHLRAHMSTDQAINTPAEASFRELAQVEQLQSASQPTHTLAPGEEGHSRGARSIA